MRQIELVDFGATRSYSATFIDNWLPLPLAAAQQDREGCLRWSLKLGYLTDEEDDVGRSIYDFLDFELTGRLIR
jgi:aarF domain-containing kinase